MIIGESEKYCLAYFTYKCANRIGMMLYYKRDIEIIKKYVEELINIENLYDYEMHIWDMLNKTINITNELTISDIKDIFRDNRAMSDEELKELDDENIVEELDDTLSYYKRLYKKKKVIDELETTYENLNLGMDIDKNQLIELIEKTDDKSVFIGNGLDNLKEQYNSEKDKTIISTAIKQIDDIGADFVKGTVNTIFGYTGSFKTLYCTNIAYNAIKHSLNTCYISLEISEENMYYNFLSRYSNETEFKKRLCHVDMKRRKLSLEDKEYLFNELVPSFTKNLSKHLIILDENIVDVDNYVDFNVLLKKVDDDFKKKTEKGVDLIIIDHVNLLKFDQKNNMNDYSKINHWMSFFRKNSINYVGRNKSVCFVVAAQSSRSGYENARKNSGIYTLDGIAEGNEIERSSSTVISIYTDLDLKNNNQAQMQVLKSRDCREIDEPIAVDVDAAHYLIGKCVEEKNQTDDTNDADEELDYNETY